MENFDNPLDESFYTQLNNAMEDALCNNHLQRHLAQYGNDEEQRNRLKKILTKYYEDNYRFPNIGELYPIVSNGNGKGKSHRSGTMEGERNYRHGGSVRISRQVKRHLLIKNYPLVKTEKNLEP